MAATTMTTSSSSPMRAPGLYSSSASPSTLRFPQAPRLASTSTPLPLGTSSSANSNSGAAWSSPDRRQPVSVVAGAEGGVEAIAVRRRGSNSFKTMSTGSLVSNSPFAKRLGQVTSSPNVNGITSPTMSPTTTMGSRIPATTKYGGLSVGLGALNGSRRKVSGDNEENRKVSGECSNLDEHEGKIVFDGTSTGDLLPRSRSASPTVPFRPIRSVNPSNSMALARSTTTMGASNAAFKPSRPVFMTPNGSHHAKSASVGSGPVSNSPFLARTKDGEASPPLKQAPYEIAPLSHESAPFNFNTATSSFNQPRAAPPVPRPTSQATLISPFSLGHRPGQASYSGGERRFGGSADPPPNTPPHARSATSESNGSPAPASAMSPHRRGAHPSTETETHSTTASQVIRRQPSAKTVTWAATEEVLEFEVDDRRASGVSYASSTSDDAGYYGHEQDDSTEVEEGNSSMGFEEGGSVEVHDYNSSEDDDDDGESAVSTVDELIDNIDQFMVEERGYHEFYSPSQITSDFDARSMGEVEVAAPSSTFSSSTTTTTSNNVSTGEEVGDDASNYSDDAEGGATQETIPAHDNSTLQASATKASSTSSPWSLQRPLPNFPTTEMGFLDSVLMMDSPQQSKAGTSTFELPDIPGSSPLMDFGDDGTAGSVATLDMAPPVTRMTRASTSAIPPSSQPLNASSYPLRSVAQSAPAQLSPPKPTQQESIGDSPILSAFNRTSSPLQPLQLSPQLSRKGSVHSDATSSLSYYGSISSGSNGPIFMGRGRLDEKLSAHQAMLEALSPPSTSTGRFPNGAVISSKKADNLALDEHQSQTREIHAKAASKPSSATLSTGMMPTIHGSSVVQGLNIGVGALLTPQLANAMSSPLDRLQRGVERAEGGSDWNHGDSLSGVAEVAQRGEESEGEGEEELKTILKKPGGRPTRRRSLSTGDAEVSETSSSTDDTPKKLELRFERRLAGVPEVEAFGMSTQSSLDDIFNSRHHSYRVREHKVVINATDSNRLSAVNKAGDLAASPAVRRKRPSNMHEIKRSLSTVSVTSTASRRSKAFRGQLFVHIREVQIDGVPMPRERTNVIFSLDNGKQRVEAGRRVLEPWIAVRKEFELVCSPDLVFSIDLSVRPPPSAPVPVPQARTTPPPPPLSPTKTPGSRLRALLSSPKKKAASSAKAVAATSALPMPVAVAPDPFYSFVAPDGKFASATVRFVDEALRCRHKRARITIPFSKNPSLPPNRRVLGSVTIDLFYLPSISGIDKAALPKSMDESIEGMRLAEYSIGVTHEGVLTQMGGDCSVWRRRNMKLRANRLVPYSEVTKMSHVEIDLSLIKSIEDLNAPASGSKSAANFDADDVMSTMDNSFRLVFKDETSIDFYADTNESKKRWMKEISQAISVTATDPVPQWALLAKRQAAKKAQ
ncbi:BQ2448_705 [Microbotryum intermedium]|uniref:BQ2448_705 protein n=1 Tax=Microbotryum intermedium TaxID=269621 RepID=A0A238F9P2_9BASI|nr:BQ2448_705 [Microbotryum intermedium]